MLDARAHFIANIIIVIAILQTLVSLTVCLCVAGREKMVDRYCNSSPVGITVVS